MTLNAQYPHYFTIRCFSEPPTKIWMQIDPYYQGQKINPMTPVSSNSFWRCRVYADIREGSSEHKRLIATNWSPRWYFNCYWQYEFTFISFCALGLRIFFKIHTKNSRSTRTCAKKAFIVKWPFKVTYFGVNGKVTSLQCSVVRNAHLMQYRYAWHDIH